jgi:hypothetical protein
MRKLTFEICGEDRDLVATFAASVEIAEKVGDPLFITREAAVETVMLGEGIPYSPKWRFTVSNVPQVIHIGLKAAGEKVKLSEVQEWAFETGFPDAQRIAAEYIALITRPAPEESTGEAGDADTGE